MSRRAIRFKNFENDRLRVLAHRLGLFDRQRAAFVNPRGFPIQLVQSTGAAQQTVPQAAGPSTP